jgi:A/G-specific adenine glycosylase
MAWDKKLIAWYADNHRKLPWRSTTDPYRIWVSEIILQQTRVDQGTGYYHNFIQRFPDVHSLAAAGEDEVLKIWQGLGYYSRARNMHKTARIIAEKHAGSFPQTYEELIQLKGIGPYTAAAIASICFNQPHPVIDGNVYRVISRWFAIEQPIDSLPGKNMIVKALNEIFDHDNPGTFNQALMEFGATVCTPKNPACSSCIFQNQCSAYHSQLVGTLPKKSKSAKTQKRYFHYLVPIFAEEKSIFTLIKKRPETDIWAGLYDFPMIESSEALALDALCGTAAWQQFFPDAQPQVYHVSKAYKHQLTHRQIFATFYILELKKHADINFRGTAVKPGSIDSYPLPRLVDIFIGENKIFQQFISGKNDYKSLSTINFAE